MNCCYKGYINEFLSLTKEEWLLKMIDAYKKICNENPHELQVNAWKDCYDKLSFNFIEFKDKKFYLIFEYVLPHEGGRRPDVIMLLDDSTILVLEFKEKSKVYFSDLDQVKAYTRNLQNYHKFSRKRSIYSVLIPTKTLDKSKVYDAVIIISPDRLGNIIKEKNKGILSYNPEQWINSQYEPLPTLIEAAKKIYNKEDLPYIKRANSAGIPKAVETIKKFALLSSENNYRTLVLATGVPGAGKTLLGLKCVYECFDDITKKSIFLSGNGPLVDVLQYTLKSDVFVKPLRNYVKYYGIEKKEPPTQHIVAFDEAQRAWDVEQMKSKYGLNASEPDIIIKIADMIPDWALFLGLIGEGQEIHKGEEAGVKQWRAAIEKSKNQWRVVCPSKIAYVFEGMKNVTIVDELNLNISLRSHIAEDVASLVDELLRGNMESAKSLSPKIKKQGFDMYITRNLEKAKKYCKQRYLDDVEKRYGLLASSKAKVLINYGVDNSYDTTKKLAVGPWFIDGIKSKLSCCSLNKVSTEFACQGLELDMPIICWGDDMIYEVSAWKKFKKNSSGIKDSDLLRKNSYRVLLTRGRDGFIIYMPNDKMFDSTYQLMIEIGMTIIKE